MLRRTLTILSLIGLLLSVAAWFVAWRTYAAYFASCGKIGTGYGCVLFGWYGECMDAPLGWDIHEVYLRYWWIHKTQFGAGGPSFWIPLWIPALLFASILSISYCVPFHRRRKRKKLGLCLKCGYDLRGSKERCPECGTEFETTCVQWSP